MLNKKYPASILVVTIMIMGIILVTALSISTVSNKKRNASIGSSQSAKAYQIADGGIEEVMDFLIEYQEKQIKDIHGLDCSAPGIHAIITGDGYTVELKKTDDDDETTCATFANEITSIKYIGTSGNTQRAIETPVVVD